MKKIYSILMASAVALSASAISIETTEFGAVQDFRMPEGIVSAKTLSEKIHKLPASGILPKVDLSGKKFIKPDSPKSRVLGGFEGDVTDYSMFVYVDYFEEVQMASVEYGIEITKEATDDADAEVAVSGFLPSGVQGVKPLKGTMSPSGEITLPFGQVILEQKNGTATRQYKFESPLNNNTEDALYYTYNSDVNQFVASAPAGVAVYDNGQLAGFYGIWMNSFFAVPNGAFIFEAQAPNAQEAEPLALNILVIKQHDAEADVDLCFVCGLSPFGDSMVPYFEMVDGGMYAINSKCFFSPNFGTQQSPMVFNDFMLASYDETLKSCVFPVVATYTPEMGLDPETQEKAFDVYRIPLFQFIDPYMSLNALDAIGYTTGDAYIFMETGEASGVEDVVAAPAKGNARYYNIQGMEVKNPTKGQLLIEKVGDASRKVIF